MDSGIRSGPDVARAMACGAAFTFLGRSFMYGVAAMGNKGGNHTISILKTQLQQVMEQYAVKKPGIFRSTLSRNLNRDGYERILNLLFGPNQP